MKTQMNDIHTTPPAVSLPLPVWNQSNQDKPISEKTVAPPVAPGTMVGTTNTTITNDDATREHHGSSFRARWGHAQACHPTTDWSATTTKKQRQFIQAQTPDSNPSPLSHRATIRRTPTTKTVTTTMGTVGR